MGDYKPDDIVDVTIKGAKVIGDTYYNDGIVIEYGPSWRTPIPADDPYTTITKRAPKPKAGDVWRTAGGEIVAVHKNSLGEVAGFPVTNEDLSWGIRDLSGATRLFTLGEI